MNRHANRLLAALDAATLLKLPLQHMDLKRGETLIGANEPIEHVHFMETGLASVVAVVESRHVEIGIAGREGMTGVPLIFGVDRSPYETFIQIAGTGWRLPTNDLLGAMADDTSFGAMMKLYAYAFGAQVAETAFSNSLFSLEQRLARWLLLCHERTDGDEIAITHEFLSVMLGVRRPAVTLSVQTIEGAGMIRATRGVILIRNRPQLMEAAGDAYGVSTAEYERLLGAI